MTDALLLTNVIFKSEKKLVLQNWSFKMFSSKIGPQLTAIRLSTPTGTQSSTLQNYLNIHAY